MQLLKDRIDLDRSLLLGVSRLPYLALEPPGNYLTLNPSICDATETS